MASAVEVLCPNGRRQVVKITPQTSILQVLEEVCTRHGFPAAEFTLKHGRTTLDMGILFRYSGLPNNAKLELIKSEKMRIESQVQVALQLEDGCRVQRFFAPSTFLWDILSYWNNEKSSPIRGQILKMNEDVHPVVIYVREEIIGEDALKYTSLRALGITCGNVILRLIHRDVPQSILDSINMTLHKEQQKLELLKAKALSEQQDITPTSWELSPVPEVMDYTQNDETENVRPILPPSTNIQKSSHKKKHHTSSSRPDSSFANFKFPEETKGKSLYNVNDRNDSTEIQNTDNELPRATVVFNLNDVQLQHEDYAEEFFEVTIDDVRKRMVSLQQERVALEQQPLSTKAMREASGQERLMKYEYVIIRIQFPDRFVLQGKFKPTEKVQSIKKFIQDHLSNPNHPFYLFTAPPFKLLQDDDTLLQAQLVPASLVHFGSESLPEFCLSKSVRKKSSTFELANLSAKLKIRPVSIVLPHAAAASQNAPHPLTVNQHPVSTSLRVPPSNIRSASPSTQSGSDKVPKWFLKSKK